MPAGDNLALGKLKARRRILNQSAGRMGGGMRVIVAFAALLVATGIIVWTSLLPQDVALALPRGSSISVSAALLQDAALACGIVVGVAVKDLLERPVLTWLPPLWLMGAALLIFAVPALLGDAAPARSGLALCLGAGALIAAFVAVRAMQEGEALEITSWAGGLGGGRAGFRLSWVSGLMLVVLVLAGTAVAMLAPPPSSDKTAQEKSATGKGSDKSNATPKPASANKAQED
jgi:hypothetical protein